MKLLYGLPFLLLILLSHVSRADENPNFRAHRKLLLKTIRHDADSALSESRRWQAEAIAANDRWAELAFQEVELQALTISGNLSQAKTLGETLLEQAQDFGNDTLLANVQTSLGETYLMLARFEESSLLLFDALRIFETHGNTKRVQGLTNHIGRVFAHSGNHEKAWDYFSRAVALNDSLPIEDADPSSYSNLGITAFILRGDKELARDYFQKALELYTDQDDLAGANSSLGNIGFLYFQTNDLDSAYHYLWRSHQGAVRHKFFRQQLNSLNNIALLQEAMGKQDSAIFYQQRALQLAVEKGYLEKEPGFRKDLAAMYESFGQLDSAMHYYRSAVEAIERVFNQSTTGSLVDIEREFYQEKLDLEVENLQQKQAITQLELEASQAKAREDDILIRSLIIGAIVLLGFVLILVKIGRQRKRTNETLHQLNERISGQKKQIEASLNEKDILLREIHHRVKNNLQVVSSLLSLQSNNIEDETALKAVQDGQHRVKSMALIHKKLYQTEHLTGIDFHDYLEQLAEEVALAHGLSPKQVIVNTTPLQLDIDTAVPLGLIANELLTNALKYAATKPNDQVEINLRETESGRYQMQVADEGAGLPNDFEWDQSESLGLRLVYLLSKQLKAKLHYEKQQGASFSITFTPQLKVS